MSTDEANSSNHRKDDLQTAPELHHIGVKLPTCWKENIILWFIQAEAQFSNARITSDSTKYFTVVASLDAEAIKTVSDVVTSPPAVNKYLTLKNTLIARYQESEDKRLTRLLTRLQLGDRKPSELLRVINELAGPDLADNAFTRAIWMQQLPHHAQAILSTLPGDNLPQLAAAADKIVEVYQKSECDALEKDHRQNRNNNQVYNTKQEPIVSSMLQNLQEQLITLTQEFRQLKTRQYDDRGRTSNYQKHRSESTRRAWRQPSPSSSTRGYCFYHVKFGENAHNCQQPCNFSHRKQPKQ